MRIIGRKWQKLSKNQCFFSSVVDCPVIFQRVRTMRQAHIGLKGKNRQLNLLHSYFSTVAM